eukprot:15472198-Alexandrium_andersonii.AAC.1
MPIATPPQRCPHRRPQRQQQPWPPPCSQLCPQARPQAHPQSRRQPCPPPEAHFFHVCRGALPAGLPLPPRTLPLLP